MKKKNNKLIMVIFLVVFISIGYAYLTSNFEIRGISIIPKNTWDVHFANIVDDSFSSEVNNPATISSNGKKVNFEVTFNNPGEEYYFYVDVVNDGTLDAMLDLYEVTGLSEEQKNYIEWEITYSDGIELTKYDKLTKGEKDTLKVLVRFKDNIDISVLPDNNEAINLTFKSIYVQADKSANERTTVEDKTAPDINFASNSSGTIKGNNKWYKSLSILSKLVDPSGISSAKYCVTTDESCIPDQTTDIKNNSIAFQLSNDVLGQTVCVEGIDTKENDDVVCSKEKYYVDGEDPTINKVTTNTLDDTISITVEASDQHSGINKYYYSKDGGNNYTESNNSNYTYSNISDGSYVIVAYVEDEAGNISNTANSTVTVRHKSWCEQNNIDDFGNCIISTESGDPDVNHAKETIIAKGDPDFSKTSPQYVYGTKESSSRTTSLSSNDYGYISESYDLDKTSGVLTLNDSQYLSMSQIQNLIDNGKDYYMCNFIARANDCTSIYHLESIDKKDAINYNINKYDINVITKSYTLNDNGIYATHDIDESKYSYYLRGITESNFVKFANLYWKIIRVDGNGNVKLMYFSDEGTAQGKLAGKSPINDLFYDATGVGFMYNDSDFSSTELTSSELVYKNIVANQKYYFSKQVQYNPETKKYSLVGSIEDGNMIECAWNTSYNDIIDGGYKYTCFKDKSCSVLIEINGYNDSTSAYVKFISYPSTSRDNAVKNNTKSSILIYLENWYKEHLLDYDNCIANSVYCNDRSISTGDGYSIDKTTYYGGNERIFKNNSPSLLCKDTNDAFTHKDSTIGNNKLDYSVGLLTADEIVFAGGVANKVNELYFMNYKDGEMVWTMTPRSFNGDVLRAQEFRLYPTGLIGSSYVNNSFGIRPVITLDSSKISFTGTGTKDDPFVVVEKKE